MASSTTDPLSTKRMDLVATLNPCPISRQKPVTSKEIAANSKGATLIGPSTTDLEDKISDLLDDAGFQEIDQCMARFNLFEAVGAVRGELRHSNFLAFLLSPLRSHGLGALALLRFLRAVLAKIPREQRPIGHSS